jgi:hypothetical protein
MTTVVGLFRGMDRGQAGIPEARIRPGVGRAGISLSGNTLSERSKKP